MQAIERTELEKKLQDKKRKAEQIGEWLKDNIHADNWMDKVTERNDLSVQIEVINQQLSGNWFPQPRTWSQCNPKENNRF